MRHVVSLYCRSAIFTILEIGLMYFLHKSTQNVSNILKYLPPWPVILGVYKSVYMVYLPRGDFSHCGVLVAEPHAVVVRDLPRGDKRNAVISQ